MDKDFIACNHEDEKLIIGLNDTKECRLTLYMVMTVHIKSNTTGASQKPITTCLHRMERQTIAELGQKAAVTHLPRSITRSTRSIEDKLGLVYASDRDVKQVCCLTDQSGNEEDGDHIRLSHEGPRTHGQNGL